MPPHNFVWVGERTTATGPARFRSDHPTSLIYLRFQLLRGELDAPTYESELDQVEAMLEKSERAHLHQFLAAWQSARHAG
jgi:hypothetical protein